MKNLTVFATRAALIAGLLVSVSQAQAADLEKGRQKADQVCAACHGKDGNTPVDPSYPKLAGQAADYLYEALKGYKNESRKNAIMAGMAKPLSDDDMRNLAAYYGSLPGSLRAKR